MKNLFLIFPLMLIGCAELSQPLSTYRVPYETIPNYKCAEVQKYKIFQVFNEGALAFACEEKSYTDCAYGLTVFVPKPKGQDLYDDKIIVPENEKCIAYDGVYKYESKGAGNKTVPKLKIIEADIINPEYTKWLQEQNIN